MLKKVRVTIATRREAMSGSLFADGICRVSGEKPTFADTAYSGRLLDDGERVTLYFEESEQSDLGATRSTLTHTRGEQAYTLTRTGEVRTVLPFAAGRTHEALYRTAMGDFDVLVATQSIEGDLAIGASLTLDYIVEIRGGDPEKTRLRVRIEEGKDER